MFNYRRRNESVDIEIVSWKALQLDECTHQIAAFARWNQHKIALVSKGNHIRRRGQELHLVACRHVDIYAFLALVKNKSAGEAPQGGVAGDAANEGSALTFADAVAYALEEESPA